MKKINKKQILTWSSLEDMLKEMNLSIEDFTLDELLVIAQLIDDDSSLENID